ncbi:translation initiation factor eIF2B subunit alpha [Starmerella bacillaris]|uniref:Translation initiation factor eIF2B subunit alpha n=1 Tax=Starmerella bacillaris TaxID=1247836 RepID=A0AAV5RIW6_STABA|nr:translation initiation factor eIF2B subunit alpha [Starmerella bacillaris]
MIDIKETYLGFLERDNQLTKPVAAIQALLALLCELQPNTSAEMIDILQDAANTLKSSVSNSISLSAGCDLFLRFLTKNINASKDWDACRRNLVQNGNLFASRALDARSNIARIGLPFVRDHDTILVHGRSRAVIQLLQDAAMSNSVRFRVYITEARVCNEGVYMANILKKSGIPVCVVPDCSVGYVIDHTDKVFIGAEGVAESGGVINQIGSYQVAMLAKAANKPVYVFAESHKFVRMFPVSPSDLPGNEKLEFTSPVHPESIEMNLEAWPQVDFTPHQYITALVTDLGVLTPSGVSEELIKMWFD